MTVPVLRRVAEIDASDGHTRLPAPGGQPLLVRGALRHWSERPEWTFDGLADFCDRNAPGTDALLQSGVIEQGDTPPAVRRTIADYLREIGRLEATAPEASPGFAVSGAYERATCGDPVEIGWDTIADRRDREYLQLWELFDAVPAVRRLVPTRDLWPGTRLTWGYGFAGPGGTLTGLHSDISNNWFCQLRGTKEFLLFGPRQRDKVFPSRKFDWGSELSEIDIAHLDRHDAATRAKFAEAEGWIARVGAGDALFVPGRTWHAVVARTPSLSLGIFGLGPAQVLVDGIPIAAKRVLHRLHLYRRGNCACHATTSHAATAEAPRAGGAAT